MACPSCPCGATCLAWPIFCQWSAEDPSLPGHAVRVAHVVARSAMGDAHTSPPSADPSPSPGDFPPVAKTVELVRATKACPFRSTDATCGCSGARCALRGGNIVSHLDCFACVLRYG